MGSRSTLGNTLDIDMYNNPESPDNSQRKGRAQIAAQACQTCRNRKSRCDEQQPKCGLCRRLNVDCLYREPQPTKKDKTMVHILETLQRLETKFDSLSVSYSSTPSSGPAQSAQGDNQTPPALPAESRPHPTRADFLSQHAPGQEFPKELQRSFRHLTAAHKMIMWPAIYLQIIDSNASATDDLQFVLQGGTPWFLHLELDKYPQTLPCPPEVQGLVASSVRAPPATSSFAGLTVDNIQRLADAYFNTFNIIHPILNRDEFLGETVGPMIRNGYTNGDDSACLALMVFALGQLAIDGVFGQPITNVNGVQSGIRGGSALEPPGLELFNEARRRMGFILHKCTLENVQIYLLQACYYESCARHTDYWRCCVDASMSCQALIRCAQIDWATPKADLVKRAYWACMLNEDLYHIELDLPQTGIHQLEDHVPLPYFDAPRSSSAAVSEERSHFQYHFLAMIALRRLITRIHSSLHGSSYKPAEYSEDYNGPPVHVIKELGRQLESWRSLLPQPLQWSDSDRHDFPNINPMSRRPADSLFATDQGNVPINHRFNLDIVTGQLRTRFYYAKFMIYRPFIYKALHFPELMEPEDENCCAMAIRAACLWPLAMAPCKNKKRLVPHLFTWTQNFVGILLMLRMTTENERLKRICEAQVDKAEIETTVNLLLDWISDMRQVDGIAQWSWRVLHKLFFPLEEQPT